MKKRVFTFALAVVMILFLLPTVLAAAPEAGIRDMRSYEWTQYSQECPEPHKTFSPGSFDSALYNQYNVEDYYTRSTVHFILYENGELYFSQEDEPSEKDFRKVMENVKEINSVWVPGFAYYTLYQYAAWYSFGGWAPRQDKYEDEWLQTVELTTILTEDGKLYLMGVPQEIPEENRSLGCFDKNKTGSYGYWNTMKATNYFPFPFADTQAETVLVAEGIARIVPKYPYRLTAGSSYNVNGGFYVTEDGECFVGFPAKDVAGEKLPTNVINYLPYGNNSSLELLEDGTLVRGGSTVAENVKDFNGSYYLKSNGMLYSYDRNTQVDAEVVSIFGGYGYYIKEDGSLWKSQNKIMEDVATVFQKYVVRGNGDVFILESDSSGQLIPRKVLSGNGYAPNPAPAIHAGKIFKDASSWALVDLRAARDSGLTIPTDGLSYNQPITREKFAEVSVKLYEALSGAKAPAVAQNPFTDTKNPEILKAHALGIVKGTGPNTFSPDAKINRESIATMLMRTVNAAGAKLPAGTPVTFADGGKISGWAKDAVTAMANANIVRGVGGDRFDPQGTATVEQSIIMANRILR